MQRPGPGMLGGVKQPVPCRDRSFTGPWGAQIVGQSYPGVSVQVFWDEFNIYIEKQ